MPHLMCQIVVWSFVIVIGNGVVHADVKEDEARIQTIQEDVTQDFSAAGQRSHAETLAKQFDLSQSDIQKLRTSGKGWGEVTIQLSVADRLFTEDQKLAEPRFHNYSEAVDEVNRLRYEGGGWGKISQTLGFKLGPVIRDAQHTRNEIRWELRLTNREGSPTIKSKDMTRGSGEQRVGRDGSRPQKPEKFTKPERPQRPERPAKAQRPDRPSRSNRPGK